MTFQTSKTRGSRIEKKRSDPMCWSENATIEKGICTQSPPSQIAGHQEAENGALRKKPVFLGKFSVSFVVLPDQ